MRLADIMSKPLLTIEVGASGREAWNLMRLNGVHHLGVTEDGRIIGILSYRDLERDRSAAATVAERMTTPVVTATPRTTVRQAANLLRGRAIGCLLIVEGRRPVGIVTVSDVLELVGRGVEKSVASSTRWTLRHRGPRRRAIPGRQGKP
jgi:CBS domain-containing protein